MPIYEYECKKCGHNEERVYNVDKKPEYLDCPKCRIKRALVSIISVPQAMRPDWEPYWDENMGDKPVLVKSRQHRRELKKKRGLRDQYHRKPGMPGQWV